MAEAAWLAFEERRLEVAKRLFSRLIAAAASDELRDVHRRRFAYVLMAQGRRDEARAVYQALFDRHGCHRDLHQLGMVEREAGDLRKALGVFRREAELLRAGDHLAVAANLYEQALIHHGLGDDVVGFRLLDECMASASRSGSATMLGAASRLCGDMLAARAPGRARDAYEAAIRHFTQAQDQFGVAEVRARLASLSLP